MFCKNRYNSGKSLFNSKTCNFNVTEIRYNQFIFSRSFHFDMFGNMQTDLYDLALCGKNAQCELMLLYYEFHNDVMVLLKRQAAEEAARKAAAEAARLVAEQAGAAEHAVASLLHFTTSGGDGFIGGAGIKFLSFDGCFQYMYLFFDSAVLPFVINSLLPYSLVILGILLVSTVRNPFYAVISFMGVSLVVSWLIIMMTSTFLGLSFLLVYLGAMCILFIFVVMMFRLREMDETWQINYLTFGVLIGLFFAIVYVVRTYYPYSFTVCEDLYSYKYDSVSNITAIGNVLYTEFFIVFIVLGLILLVVLISCITIAFEYRGINRTSDVVQQIGRFSRIDLYRKSGVQVYLSQKFSNLVSKYFNNRSESGRGDSKKWIVW